MNTDRVPFGQTDLQVSPLCQGTAFRHLPRADSPEGLAVLRHCLDQGGNFFDSAQAYGWGGGEEVLGRAIAGRRDEVRLLTKIGLRWDCTDGERFVTDDGVLAGVFQQPAKCVEDFGSGSDCLSCASCTDRHDHEFLDIDRIICVGTAVDNVYHRHWQGLRIDPADETV